MCAGSVWKSLYNIFFHIGRLFPAVFTVWVIIVTISVDNAYSETTLTWDVPSTYDDGSPLTDLVGYKVYYGISPGNYTQSVDAGNATLYIFSDLADGNYYFVVTAYDEWGNESDYSNEVTAYVSSVRFVKLNIVNSGDGIVAGSGIYCSGIAGGICTMQYKTGAIVSLFAKPSAGSIFTGWGGICAGIGNCIVSMSKDMNIGAKFENIR